MILNLWFTWLVRARFGGRFDFGASGIAAPASLDTSPLTALWALECALAIAIAFVLVWCLRGSRSMLPAALQQAIGGAMLAAMNVGSEYGFGAVIASLPGFQSLKQHVAIAVHDPLVNVAVTSNILAGITGSASGGMSIALAAMSDTYLRQAAASGIPHEVLHRVAAMASGGMDTLPHNGAIITLLAITGLTHREAYRDIFALTVFKIAAAFLVIVLYLFFRLV